MPTTRDHGADLLSLEVEVRWTLTKSPRASEAMFMDHPLRTLLYELFIAPILELLQRLWRIIAGTATADQD